MNNMILKFYIPNILSRIPADYWQFYNLCTKDNINIFFNVYKVNVGVVP